VQNSTQLEIRALIDHMAMGNGNPWGEEYDEETKQKYDDGAPPSREIHSNFRSNNGTKQAHNSPPAPPPLPQQQGPSPPSASPESLLGIASAPPDNTNDGTQAFQVADSQHLDVEYEETQLALRAQGLQADIQKLEERKWLLQVCTVALQAQERAILCGITFCCCL
jgi:hypothetical protein